MAPILNKDFNELAADGSNYLTWAMDVKILLTTNGFIRILNEPDPQDRILETEKFRTLHFLRHHLHPDLKNEYLMEDDPKKLWDSLKECYNQQQSIEKTLSTFLPTNRILQQQYLYHNYTKYSDLIYDLLQAEKHDELLTKNHQLRPVGAAPLPEVHFNVQNNNKKLSGKKFKKNFKGKWKKCGCHNHIARKCNTPKHLVDLYQKYAAKQVHGDKIEAHFNTTDAGCSKGVPAEHNNEKIQPQLDDSFGTGDMQMDTDDMIVDFQSNNIFGDMN
uniref:Retrotransposon Copia-like N-terminal domain-containing protein n=1 Tax=Setaria italica TaxID=4555 RepID=K4A1X9_SETIT